VGAGTCRSRGARLTGQLTTPEFRRDRSVVEPPRGT